MASDKSNPPGTQPQAQSAANSGIIVNRDGYIVHASVQIKPIASLGNRAMKEVTGIVVHQTDSPTLQSALNTAQRTGTGTHFYIDRDGAIYQAASMNKTCGHVGNIRPRCLAEHRVTPAEEKRLAKAWANSRQVNREEMKKSFPDRYPSNKDSIGIEIVGDATPDRPKPGQKAVFEPVNEKQNQSLKWLIQVVSQYHKIKPNEIYRHPVLSYKNETEAATAKW